MLLRAPDGFWWLDILEGTLTRPWTDTDAVRAAFADVEGQDSYLLAGLAHAAERRGLTLTADQVYDFQQPPILGGELIPDNIGVIDFVVGLNIAGQIHEQVRDLPPGTPITIG